MTSLDSIGVNMEGGHEMEKDRKVTQEKINSIMRWVGFTVYSAFNKKYKFVKAYDRLVGKVYLDHEFVIPVAKKGETMFDGLSNEKLALVLDSAVSLRRMYAVLDRKGDEEQ